MKSMEQTITTARISLDAMPLHRDVRLPVDYSGRLIAESVLRRLFTEDDVPAQGCAVGAEMLDDGRRWRIALDSDLRWSDGNPLRAEDVVEAADHALTSRSNSAALFLGDTAAGNDVPVRALRADTVEFRFGRPVAFAPALLSLPAFAPLRRGPDGVGAPALGDYTVADWDTDAVVLDRRPELRHADALDSVRFEHVPLAAEAVRLFRSGELDATSPTGFGVAEVTELTAHPGAVRQPVDIFGSLDLGRRAPRPWLRSAAARRGVSAVLDRARLETVTAGLAEPWRWPSIEALGEGAPDAIPSEEGAQPEEGAQRPAGEAGPIEIAYSAFDPNAEIAEEVAAQLRAALGAEVVTRQLSFDAYVKASVTRDFCLLYSLTTPAFSHPAGSLSDWRSTGRAARRSGLADPVLDAALDAAESCPEPGEAARLWARASDRWCALLPKIPLVRVRAWYLRGRRLSGLTVSRAGLMYLGAA
ncbi:ABC transporter substrate-binding protein [Streptomyces sp. NPDC023327]|uniref:ABC transporter substrate-binding protein n=1 Tax=Streptomyces sp. NPDC023327 TaxID=3157088 RepID=UPI0033FED516